MKSRGPKLALWWRLLSLHAAWNRKRIRLLSKQPRPIAFTTQWGGIAVIHPDTYPKRAGMWRTTWLDRDGEPYGHDDKLDFASALRRAKEGGAHLFNEVPTPLEPSPEAPPPHEQH